MKNGVEHNVYEDDEDLTHAVVVNELNGMSGGALNYG